MDRCPMVHLHIDCSYQCRIRIYTPFFRNISSVMFLFEPNGHNILPDISLDSSRHRACSEHTMDSYLAVINLTAEVRIAMNSSLCWKNMTLTDYTHPIV